MTLTFIPTPGEFLVRNPFNMTELGGSTETIFTVTGDVYVRILARCIVSGVSLAGAKGELGIAGKTDEILPSTLITDLGAGEWWHDATPDSEVESVTIQKEFYIADGNDIILTLDALVDGGTVMFYCYWTPLGDGSIVEFP